MVRNLQRQYQPVPRCVICLHSPPNSPYLQTADAAPAPAVQSIPQAQRSATVADKSGNRLPVALPPDTADDSNPFSYLHSTYQSLPSFSGPELPTTLPSRWTKTWFRTSRAICRQLFVKRRTFFVEGQCRGMGLAMVGILLCVRVFRQTVRLQCVRKL